MKLLFILLSCVAKLSAADLALPPLPTLPGSNTSAPAEELPSLKPAGIKPPAKPGILPITMPPVTPAVPAMTTDPSPSLKPAGITPPAKIDTPPVPTLTPPVAAGAIKPAAPIAAPAPAAINTESASAPAPLKLAPPSLAAQIPNATAPTTDFKDLKANFEKDLKNATSFVDDFDIKDAQKTEQEASVEKMMDKQASIEKEAEGLERKIQATFDKSDAELDAFDKEFSDKIWDFEYFYKDVKNYVTSNQSSENEEVKQETTKLDFGVKEFLGLKNNINSLGQELENARKELLTQLKSKNTINLKIRELEAEAEVLRAEFANFGKSIDDKNSILKKLEESVSNASNLLNDLKSIESTFQSKADAISGKVSQIKDSAKNLDNKKAELDGLLKNLMAAKQKNAVNKELTLVSSIDKKDKAIKQRTSKKMVPTQPVPESKTIDNGLTKEMVADKSAKKYSFNELWSDIKELFLDVAKKIVNWAKGVKNSKNQAEPIASSSPTPPITPTIGITTPAPSIPPLPTTTPSMPTPGAAQKPATPPSIAPLITPQNTQSTTIQPTQTTSNEVVDKKTGFSLPEYTLLTDAFSEVWGGLKKFLAWTIQLIARIFEYFSK